MSARRAFTLVEVLLAMALMMALMSAFYVFFNGMGTAQQSAREAGNRQLSARTLCDMIERDLMCCIAGDAKLGAGVIGSETDLRILTRNVSAALAISGFDDRHGLFDMESAGYAFDEADASVSISRESPQRVELPSREDERDEPAARTPEESLGPIERLRFRYFDGSNWRDAFDSLAEDRLPVAVEISLWLHPLPQSPEDQWLTEDSARDRLLDERDMLEEEFITGEEMRLRDEEFASDEEENLPPPDVVRIVIIPDAQAGGGS